MSNQEEFSMRQSKLSPSQRALLEKWMRSEPRPHPGKPVIPRHLAASPLPLSFAQRRMLFENQLDPTSSRYNIPIAMRINGPLNTQAMEQTIYEIIDRHEILRTYFPIRDGVSEQVIIPTDRLMNTIFSFSNMSILPEDERQASIIQMLNVETQRPFNLTQDLSIRVNLLQVAAEEYILFLVMHHVVIDARGTDILLQEISSLYEAFSLGKPPLPPLPIQYADYAIWQLNQVQGQFLEKELHYWKQKLTDAPTFLDLPTDYPRTQKQTFHGTNYTFRLLPTLTDRLKSMSRQKGTTFFMTMLAAFQVLLYRYTGQNDLLIGTPITNRTYAETEDLIGFFLNTLVLRTTFSGLTSFDTLLTSVREVVLEAFMHQDIPFERVVEALHLQRGSHGHPLFQVMFVLQDVSSAFLKLDGLIVQPIDVNRPEVIFDLTLNIQESLEGTTCIFEYRTDLFAEQTIRRMGEQFQTLLESITQDPHQRISELSLLPYSETCRLLEDWNATHSSYPQNETLQSLFEAQVRRTPDTLALVYEDISLTYAELDGRANQLAEYLRSRGVGPDTPVGICLNRSIDQVITILGILKAGGCCVPLDLSFPKDRLLFVITTTQLRLLITSESSKSLFAESEMQLILLADEYEHIFRRQQREPFTVNNPANLCYILYTSGSTGQPKGVLMPHKPLVNLIYWYLRSSSNSHSNRTIQFSPLVFDLSFLEVFVTLAEGGTLFLLTEEVKQNADRLLYYLCVEGIERAFLPFVALQQLAEIAQSEPQNLPPLKEIVSTGEQLQFTQEIRSWLKHLKAPTLHNYYGPSETHAVTSFTLTGQLDTPSFLPPIGLPIANTQVYVLDGYMQLVPIGVRGELYVSGHSLCYGYANAPHLTAERFVPDPFSKEPGSRLYKTGDLCRYLSDGNIEYLGRLDQQVKVRGFRIELGEVEAVLNQHPNVGQAVVLLQEDVRGLKRLVAYLLAQRDDQGQGFTQPTTSSLRSYLQGKLPEYMVPFVFVWLEFFPLTATGKIDRRAFPPLNTLNIDREESLAQPLTLTESLLAEMWKEVLGLNEVGIHDNFFELGGHSLLVTRLISRVRANFNVDISLRSLFERPNIADLSRQIDTALRMQAGIQTYPIQKAATGRKRIPLSFAQQRMWLLAQLGSMNPQYNIEFVFHIEGVLNRIALERAMTALIARHEILRTCFPLYDDHPQQVIMPINNSTNLPFTLYDLCTLDENKQREEMRRLIRTEAKHTFNLARGPLMRVHLLQIGPEKHVLVLLIHHIIFDGWSEVHLFNELANLYTAFTLHQPPSLPPLSIQYADYACWQRDWMQGEVLNAELAYWKKQLDGASPFLALPTDRPRSSIQTFNGDTHSLLLSSTLTHQIKTLSQQQGATLFMILLAAFQLLLSRYSGQEDLSVGIPIANRSRSETEDLIGCFINTMVIRTSLSGSPSFLTLLARVRETALEAYMHQDIPFEYLVENLHIERHLSHHPLFQVMFSLQNIPDATLDLTGLVIQRQPLEDTTAKFDLTLAMHEGAEGISGIFEYNTDLFDKRTIERIAKYFETLLASIVTDPKQRISALPLLARQEQQIILEEWNVTRQSLPEVRTVHNLFEMQVERTPDAIAIVHEKVQLTYQELNRQANQLAHYLIHLGVGIETTVGVYLGRSADLIVALLGILKAGGAYVPIDPSYPLERVRYMLHDAGINILITCTSFQTTVTEELSTVVCLDSGWDTLHTESQENPGRYIHPENLCYVIYTSGSTGIPRGVSIQHLGVTNLIAWHQRAYNLTSSVRATQVAGLAFDATVWEIWPYLTVGASVHLPSQATHSSPEQLVEWIKASMCTHSFLPTPLAQFILTEHWLDGAALRYLLTGGDKLHQSASQFRTFAFINHYGPTENTVVTTSTAVDLSESANGDPPIGRPIMNTQVYILDPCLTPVPPGVVGELHIGGLGLARGYLGLPGLTAERFIPNPFDPEGGTRLYKTGDLARYLSDGAIEFLGRMDRQVKIRGFRIELGEIEATISRHEHVQQATVVLHETSSGEMQIAAYVVPLEGTQITPDELRQYVRKWLPIYMLPSSYVMLNTLPLTANGKVDQQALVYLMQTKGESTDSVNAVVKTEIEQTLLHIWQEVLEIETIGIHDNFFDIGGHSFLLVQVHRRVKEVFKRDITVLNLFTFPTVASLAAYLAQGQDISRDFEQDQSRARMRRVKIQQQGSVRRERRTKKTEHE